MVVMVTTLDVQEHYIPASQSCQPKAFFAGSGHNFCKMRWPSTPNFWLVSDPNPSMAILPLRPRSLILTVTDRIMSDMEISILTSLLPTTVNTATRYMVVVSYGFRGVHMWVAVIA